VKVSDNATFAKRLALTEVSMAKPTIPNVSEGLEIIERNRHDLLKKDPVDDICTGRVCQGALVVIEAGLRVY
jgi:hypothetical protein